MDASECLKKLYVKLRYIPPPFPEKPVDCKRVKISKSPEIRISEDSKQHAQSVDPIGIALKCALPFSEGVGGVHLLLQVSTYIEWEVEFTAAPPQVCVAPGPQFSFLNPLEEKYKQSFPRTDNGQSRLPSGRVVRETHRLYVSIPMAYTLSGPQIMLSRAMPWQFRIAQYAVKIWAAFKKLRELEDIMAILAKLKSGFCPEDVSEMEKALRLLEIKLNHDLRDKGTSAPVEFAKKTKTAPNDTGWFVGDRLA